MNSKPIGEKRDFYSLRLQAAHFVNDYIKKMEKGKSVKLSALNFRIMLNYGLTKKFLLECLSPFDKSVISIDQEKDLITKLTEG